MVELHARDLCRRKVHGRLLLSLEQCCLWCTMVRALRDEGASDAERRDGKWTTTVGIGWRFILRAIRR